MFRVWYTDTRIYMLCIVISKYKQREETNLEQPPDASRRVDVLHAVNVGSDDRHTECAWLGRHDHLGRPERKLKHAKITIQNSV